MEIYTHLGALVAAEPGSKSNIAGSQTIIPWLTKCSANGDPAFGVPIIIKFSTSSLAMLLARNTLASNPPLL